MPKTILIQLDCDPQPSTFDAVVAVDAGAEVLLRHGGVTPDTVVPLVHGAMFTRGGNDLAATAIFIGGSRAELAEAVAERIRATFFGPVRVGVLVDPNGANTTASAAIIAAARHVPLASCNALVLGGTGPVGQRAARLLAGRGARVTLASRSLARAEEAARRIAAPVAVAECHGSPDPNSPFGRALAAADLVVAAGAAGATLLDAAGRGLAGHAGVIIDLNAVAPAGIAGIEPTDKARRDGAAVAYGALGIGGTKMRIHKAAVARIFEPPAAFLDAEELLAIGERIEATRPA